MDPQTRRSGTIHAESLACTMSQQVSCFKTSTSGYSQMAFGVTRYGRKLGLKFSENMDINVVILPANSDVG